MLAAALGLACAHELPRFELARFRSQAEKHAFVEAYLSSLNPPPAMGGEIAHLTWTPALRALYPGAMLRRLVALPLVVVAFVACGTPALMKGPTCAEAIPAVAAWARTRAWAGRPYFIQCGTEIRSHSLEPVIEEDAAAACGATGCFRLTLERSEGRLEKLSVTGQPSRMANPGFPGGTTYRVTWALAFQEWFVSSLEEISRT